MTTKERIDLYSRINQLWCSKCVRDLTPDNTWVPDDTQDGRLFCYGHAPDDAIRAKDLS